MNKTEAAVMAVVLMAIAIIINVASIAAIGVNAFNPIAYYAWVIATPLATAAVNGMAIIATMVLIAQK